MTSLAHNLFPIQQKQELLDFSGGRSLNAVWTNKNIEPISKLILLSIANECNFNGTFLEWVPYSLKLICQRTGFSKPTVITHLKKLQEQDYLAIKSVSHTERHYSLTEKLFLDYERYLVSERRISEAAAKLKRTEGGRSLNAIWNRTDISPSQKFVNLWLGAMCDFHKGDRGFLEAKQHSHKIMSSQMGLSSDSLSRAFKVLEQKGYIEVRRQFKVANRYRLTERLFQNHANDPKNQSQRKAILESFTAHGVGNSTDIRCGLKAAGIDGLTVAGIDSYGLTVAGIDGLTVAGIDGLTVADHIPQKNSPNTPHYTRTRDNRKKEIEENKISKNSYRAETEAHGIFRAMTGRDRMSYSCRDLEMVKTKYFLGEFGIEVLRTLYKSWETEDGYYCSEDKLKLYCKKVRDGINPFEEAREKVRIAEEEKIKEISSKEDSKKTNPVRQEIRKQVEKEFALKNKLKRESENFLDILYKNISNSEEIDAETDKRTAEYEKNPSNF